MFDGAKIHIFSNIQKKTKPPTFLAGASFITKLRSIGLEVEVALAFTYLAEVALDAFLEVFFAEGLGKLLEEAQAFLLGGGAGVVLEVFAEGEHSVGFAELLDEAGLGKIHEVGTHTAFAVAPRAEAGDIAAVNHHADDLVEGAVVSKGELGAGGTRLPLHSPERHKV